MKKQWCKASTKRGNVCKNRPIKGTEYCYVHSLGKFKNIPIWRNPNIHFIVPVIITILFFIITQYKGASRINQEEILKETSTIKGLIQDLGTTETLEYNNLIKKYPSGFLLFATNYSGLITPPSSNILDNYKLNWNNVKIVFLEDNAISFLAPYITYEPADKSAHISYENILIKMPRGTPGSIYSFPLPAKVVPDNIYIEIITYTNNGIIMCVGFRNKSLGSLVK